MVTPKMWSRYFFVCEASILKENPLKGKIICSLSCIQGQVSKRKNVKFCIHILEFNMKIQFYTFTWSADWFI